MFNKISLKILLFKLLIQTILIIILKKLLLCTLPNLENLRSYYIEIYYSKNKILVVMHFLFFII